MSKAKKEEIAIAVKEDDAMLAELKDFAQENSLIQVRREILQIPRLKMVQKMSEASEGLGKPGDFVCELKGKNYGQSVEIIPIMAKESASLMQEGQRTPICKTNNLITNLNGVKCFECPYNAHWNNWGTKESPIVPKCKTSIDVMCLIGKEGNLVELNFRKTSYSAGKSLINLIFNDRLPVPFCSSYLLKARDANKKGFDYKEIDAYIERKALSNSEILAIIPIAKKMVEMDKKGFLEREELVEDEATPLFSEPTFTLPV